MNANHDSMHDKSDDALDRVIRAAKAHPSPEDVKARALRAAAALGKLQASAPGREQEPIRSETEALARNLGPVEREVFEEHGYPSDVRIVLPQNHFFAKVKTMILTHKRLTATTATLTALAGALLLYVALFSSSTVAYALEQTIQANQQVTSYHAKFTASRGGLGEVWVQLNPDGTPLRARMDFLKTEDGDKVVICTEGKAAVWFKDKKSYVVLPEKGALDRVIAMQKMCDPRAAFEQIQDREKDGKVKIETTPPAKEGDFIKLTVTVPDQPNLREVYEVNPTTKLAERVTSYSRQGNEWKETKLIEYFDYNKPIDPKVFDLDLPKDVMRVDQIQQPPGVAKGNLTDTQIAQKVARDFFEAVIAKDYAKAGLIYSGMPAERIKDGYGRLDVTRIVEVGEPLAGAHPDPSALAVPVKVECGARKWVQEFAPQVRLTDNDAATKAAREFIEALIRHDEAAARQALKAGLVFEGFSAENADKIKDLFEQYNIVTIVEAGKPAPYPNSNRLEVPIKVELERKSERIREFQPYVRPVYNQPDRWEIIGGM
jgi:hypothetical protein